MDFPNEQCLKIRPPADNGWMMMHSFKILMMQTGFAVLESSFVRSKNSANIMMKNMVDLCLGTLGFWAVGWALAYGVDPNDEDNVNPFCGTGQFFTIGQEDYAQWMFQLTFAATAATIDSGAVAERMNFKPYVIFSFTMTTLLYPLIVHWTWDQNGWLAKMGFHDFAGCGPVHMLGGMAALFMAWFIGPRHGRFSKHAEVSIRVVQGENISREGLDEIYPFVTVSQKSHGNVSHHTRYAENSTHPRFGNKLTFEVQLPKQQGETTMQRLGGSTSPTVLEGVLQIRWTEHNLKAFPNNQHSSNLSLTPEDLSEHGNLEGSQKLKIKFQDAWQTKTCQVTPVHLIIKQQAGGRGQIQQIPFSLVDRVEKWSSRSAGFSVQLLDGRTLEVMTVSESQRDEWLQKMYDAWRPTILPLLFDVSVKDGVTGIVLGQAELELSPKKGLDPQKYAVTRLLKLDRGGRLELVAVYTAAERLRREIFQACDPSKLLYGTFVLWINWYSFNAGSTQGVEDGGVELAARVAVRTTLAAVAGATVAMGWSQYQTGYVMVEPCCTGVLAGLVSITAACATVTEGESVVIGVIGVMIAVAATEWELYMEIDDPCTAFPIHGAAGAWGVIAVGLFSAPEPCLGAADGVKGLFRGGGGELLGVQLLAIVVIAAWGIAGSAAVMCTMQFLSKRYICCAWLTLRPTTLREKLGADHCEHNIHINPHLDEALGTNMTFEEDEAPAVVNRHLEPFSRRNTAALNVLRSLGARHMQASGDVRRASLNGAGEVASAAAHRWRDLYETILFKAESPKDFEEERRKAAAGARAGAEDAGARSGVDMVDDQGVSRTAVVQIDALKMQM